MSKNERQKLIEFVADVAAEQLDHFEPTERAHLYEGLALLYAGEKSQFARLAALAIRKADQYQLKFRGLLSPNTVVAHRPKLKGDVLP